MKSFGSSISSNSSQIGFCDVSAIQSKSSAKVRRKTYEETILFNPRDEVILRASRLHRLDRLTREDADALVGFLPRHARVHEFHDDVFRGHEREFLVQLGSDHGGEDDEAVGDVVEEDEEGVGEEEHFRDVDAPDGAVVEGALEPLLQLMFRGQHAWY